MFDVVSYSRRERLSDVPSCSVVFLFLARRADERSQGTSVPGWGMLFSFPAQRADERVVRPLGGKVGEPVDRRMNPPATIVRPPGAEHQPIPNGLRFRHDFPTGRTVREPGRRMFGDLLGLSSRRCLKGWNQVIQQQKARLSHKRHPSLTLTGSVFGWGALVRGRRYA